MTTNDESQMTDQEAIELAKKHGGFNIDFVRINDQPRYYNIFIDK